MELPDKLTDDELALRAKEWLVAGYEIIGMVDPYTEVFGGPDFDIHMIPKYQLVYAQEPAPHPLPGAGVVVAYYRQQDGSWGQGRGSADKSTWNFLKD